MLKTMSLGVEKTLLSSSGSAIQAKRYPDALRRDIKSDCNAAFLWLYMNDSYWLDLALPPPTAARVLR